MDAPPVLTPERIDAMLSIMAEVCLESVVEAGQRQKTADDFESFERCGRTLQRACRNLRQTIAMKQRHDREQERRADDGRRRAEAVRKDAQRAHGEAVAHKRAAVQRHLDRMLWDEYEQDEALELGDEVEASLAGLAEEADFLDTPVETLIQRLADEIGLNDPKEEPAPAPTKPSPPSEKTVGRGGVGPAPEGSHANPPALPTTGSGEADSRPDAPCPAAEPPPHPPPEPYLPPWEQLGPGQRMPGGSGW